MDNKRKRTATNKTPFSSEEKESNTSIDEAMYDIFGTPTVSTNEVPSSEPPTSPEQYSEPSDAEIEAAMRSLQPEGTNTPLRKIPDNWAIKVVYFRGVLVAIVVGSRVAWENKELFPIYRYFLEILCKDNIINYLYIKLSQLKDPVDNLPFLWKKCSLIYAADITDDVAGTRTAKVKALVKVLNHLLTKADVSKVAEVRIVEEQMTSLQEVMQMGFPASFFEKTKLLEVIGKF
jgi:hypothetical protein